MLTSEGHELDFWVWIIGVNLLPLAAVLCLTWSRARVAIPWLGLATVTVGTVPAFSSSNTLVAEGTIGVGLGWLTTTLYGLIGLVLVVGSVRLRPVPYVALGAIAAGFIFIASFYAYLPPFGSGLPGMLIFAAPGLVFVVYGVALWHRHGFSPSMRTQGLGMGLVLSLGIVVGLGAIGFFAYQSGRNDPPSWATRPLDLPRLAANSPVVVEGIVVEEDSETIKLQRPSGRTFDRVYTLYQIEVSQFWRGRLAETVSLAIPDFSPVELKTGQSYLFFFRQRADQEKFPGYWYLSEPEQVWVVGDSNFETYPGRTPEITITRQELTEVLEANPNS